MIPRRVVRRLRDVVAGKLAGWSVEFNHAESETVNGIREIRAAVLVGLGLVRAPSYPDTNVAIPAAPGEGVDMLKLFNRGKAEQRQKGWPLDTGSFLCG